VTGSHASSQLAVQRATARLINEVESEELLHKCDRRKKRRKPTTFKPPNSDDFQNAADRGAADADEAGRKLAKQVWSANPVQGEAVASGIDRGQGLERTISARLPAVTLPLPQSVARWSAFKIGPA